MHDTRRLAVFTTISLLVWIVLEGIFLFDPMLRHNLVGWMISPITLLISSLPISTTAAGYGNAVLILLFSWTPFVLGSIWLFRTAQNTRHATPELRLMRPGWLIFWSWMPIAQVIVPYRSMRRIYLYHLAHQRITFNAFWAVWCISFGLPVTLLFTFIIDTSAAFDFLARYPQGFVVASFGNIPLALFLILCLRNLTRAQNMTGLEVFD